MSSMILICFVYIIQCIEKTATKNILISFDAGPSKNILHCLKILDDYNVPVCFHMNMKNIRNNIHEIDYAKMIDNLKNSTHTLGLYLDKLDCIKDIDDSLITFVEIFGKMPVFIRLSRYGWKDSIPYLKNEIDEDDDFESNGESENKDHTKENTIDQQNNERALMINVYDYLRFHDLIFTIPLDTEDIELPNFMSFLLPTLTNYYNHNETLSIVLRDHFKNSVDAIPSICHFLYHNAITICDWNKFYRISEIVCTKDFILDKLKKIHAAFKINDFEQQDQFPHLKFNQTINSIPLETDILSEYILNDKNSEKIKSEDSFKNSIKNFPATYEIQSDIESTKSNDDKISEVEFDVSKNNNEKELLNSKKDSISRKNDVNTTNPAISENLTKNSQYVVGYDENENNEIKIEILDDNSKKNKVMLKNSNSNDNNIVCNLETISSFDDLELQKYPKNDHIDDSLDTLNLNNVEKSKDKKVHFNLNVFNYHDMQGINESIKALKNLQCRHVQNNNTHKNKENFLVYDNDRKKTIAEDKMRNIENHKQKKDQMNIKNYESEKNENKRNEKKANCAKYNEIMLIGNVFAVIMLGFSVI